MKHLRHFILAASTLLVSGAVSLAETLVVVDHNDSEQATAGFKFKRVRAPSKDDAAARAVFTVVEGARDANGGSLAVLQDGRMPADEDQPAENFFFRAGGEGGRLLLDLTNSIEIKEVNTYSWHPGTRGPQVYTLYASEGTAEGFIPQPKKGKEPQQCGWKLVAKVDTRPKEGDGGGQYGVSLSNPDGSLGKYRFLLFDISRTEDRDTFGNTFYSEIDVIDRNAPPPQPVEALAAAGSKKIYEAGGGKFKITIDTSETPDLTEWTEKELAPVVQEWYPKLVQMLPSEGYEAPRALSIVFSKGMQGVAATSGTRIRCAAGWIRRNLKGEAVGAIVHEMVHVVQQYGRARRTNPNATRTPGWLTEGITDYIRFYHYEPQTHGAEITRRNLSRARYDASYRVTANFLNWVTEKYDKEFVWRLNAAIRDGKYNEGFWKTLTGRTVQELGEAWKQELEKKLAEK